MKSTPYWMPFRSLPGMSRGTALMAPAQMATASKRSWSSSKVMSRPTRVSKRKETPSRSTSLKSISMAWRGRRKAGTPTSIVPPAMGSSSKTVTWWPATASSRATARPAGPAPTTATVVSRGVMRGISSGMPDWAAAAGALAGCRADVGAHGGDRVRLSREDVALLEATLGGQVEVAAAVGAHGTGFLALDVALQPGRVHRLDEELLVAVDDHAGSTLLHGGLCGRSAGLARVPANLPSAAQRRDCQRGRRCSLRVDRRTAPSE